MRAASIAASLLLTTVTTVTAAPIVGGTAATAGEYPTAVEIDYGSAAGSGTTCSGVLVGSDWVVTSAVCLTSDLVHVGSSQADVTAAVRVHVGTVDVLTTPGTVMTATATLPDPSFDSSTTDEHDVGLIHLSAPVAGVTPSLVNFHPEDAPVGITVTNVGFGVGSASGSGFSGAGIERSLQQTSQPCAQVSALGTDDNVLCFEQETGDGTCSGDAGAPAFASIGSASKVVGTDTFTTGSCAVGLAMRMDSEVAFLTANAPVLECRTDNDCVNSTTCNGSGQCDTNGGISGDAGLTGGGGSGGGGCATSGGASGGWLLGLGALGAMRGLRRRPSSPRCRSPLPAAR